MNIKLVAKFLILLDHSILLDILYIHNVGALLRNGKQIVEYMMYQVLYLDLKKQTT